MCCCMLPPDVSAGVHTLYAMPCVCHINVSRNRLTDQQTDAIQTLYNRWLHYQCVPIDLSSVGGIWFSCVIPCYSWLLVTAWEIRKSRVDQISLLLSVSNLNLSVSAFQGPVIIMWWFPKKLPPKVVVTVTTILKSSAAVHHHHITKLCLRILALVPRADTLVIIIITQTWSTHTTWHKQI